MHLTLHSDEADALAHELAALTGESVAAAVLAALRERLERERTDRANRARLERVTAMAADIRAHITGPAGNRDPDRFGGRGASRTRTAQASVAWERTPKR